MTQQLLDLVVADPVVLLIVENRNEHVQVRQQVAQPARRAQRDREQPARTEDRHALVELVARRLDRVAERLEQRAEECLAAAAGNSREPRFERQLDRRKVGLPLASTAQRGVEPARKHDREQRRRDVRPVVDVLILGTALARRGHGPSRPDRRRAARPPCRRSSVASGIEDRGAAERKLPRVHVLRVLVQQESEIGGRPVGRSNGQEHARGVEARSRHRYANGPRP